MTDILETWDHVLNFRPGIELQRQLTKKGGRVQFIEDGKGKTSTDLYSVQVNRLPKELPFDKTKKVFPGVPLRKVTAELLLFHIRTHINRIVNTKNTRFSFYGEDKFEKAQNKALWNSDNPVGALLHLDIHILRDVLAVPINIEDATVLVTQSVMSPMRSNWLFTTVYMPQNYYHPVSGNRQFGFVKNKDGTFTFFTKGADRVSGYLEFVGNAVADAVHDGQVELWTSFQRKLAKAINSNGGEAKIVKPIIN